MAEVSVLWSKHFRRDIMPNRMLTEEERQKLFLPLISDVRNRLEDLSGGDMDLMWALRRKLYKTLTYDERDNPTNRRILKQVKKAIQKNKCAHCGKELPEKTRCSTDSRP